MVVLRTNLHLWEYRWVRDLVLLVVVAVVLMAAFAARAILAPVLVAVVLAYVFNPLVNFSQIRWRMPRWVSTLLLMVLVVAVLAGLTLFIVPEILKQAQRLSERARDYLQIITEYLGSLLHIHWDQLSQLLSTGPAGEAVQKQGVPLDLKSVGSLLVQVLGYGLNLLNSTISLTVYLALVLVVVSVSFFYFSWKFDRMVAWFAQFIPKASQAQTLAIIARLDVTVAAFVRGRLIQGLVMAAILTLGWWLCAVPYWLLLGVAAGTLNLVPFAAVVGWLLAVVLGTVDYLHEGGGFTVWVMIWPTLVYLVAQALDGWVVEPMVQGKATDLDPLTVLLAVLIGGTLAGVVGLIVAIPVAACVKILCQELVLPRLRAASNPTAHS